MADQECFNPPMKHVLTILMFVGFVVGAYLTAQSKIDHKVNLSALQLGMSLKQVETSFGSPTSQERNQITYIFDDSSELKITLRDDVVASAKVKFHRPLKIEDPQMRQLTLVQMESNAFDEEKQSWFFAGKPSEGLIYKITSDGVIESLTWVPPFTYGNNNQPKQLSALVHDFQNQHSVNL
jgi:hypothetical protein